MVFKPLAQTASLLPWHASMGNYGNFGLPLEDSVHDMENQEGEFHEKA
jgi:hypothetical protein